MSGDSRPVRLYLDADVHRDLAQALRLRGFDVLSAWEAGNAALSDSRQLQFAAISGRAILTFNVPDFVALGAGWQRLGRHHWGIVLSPQVTLTLALQRVSRLLSTARADDLRDQVLWLPRYV
jgi:hypothetical protein